MKTNDEPNEESRTCMDCLRQLSMDELPHVNACYGCQVIRQHEGRCPDCGDTLPASDQPRDCFRCVKCLEIWDSLPPFDPKCSKCGTSLEQDPENLWELWCPKCLHCDQKLKLVNGDDL